MSGISKLDELPGDWFAVFLTLQSGYMCDWLRKITNILDITIDDYNSIGQWAGLRTMDKGSYQLIHSDARLHPHLRKEKKLTMVGYMNKTWKSTDEGCLEIWDNDMKKCVDKIEPLFNRVVLFENTKTSHHGVPKVNSYRKSFLASWLRDPVGFDETRTKALFKKRPNEENSKLIDKIAESRSKLNDY